ncbi:hypothetical protein SMICM17S_11968 [Streptomyces microflavus]
MTLTFTMSPGFTTSRGSFTNVFDSADTCTRPSWWTPMSTNAPNAATFVTTPSSTMPGSRSPSFSTPSLKVAVRNAGRGSRPGFSSSLRMSVTVGRPNMSSTKSAARSDLRASALPISEATSPPAVFPIRRTTGYASGCTLEPSSGSSPPRMRRKPAHCSYAFGPSRATSLSALRERKGPLVSRCVTMFSASPELIPDTRESSGAEAVLTSTPTPFTQSSTTASSERDSFTSDRSCWYWPTPIDFGSIFTSSASGSCSRRAIETAPRNDTSMSGSSCEAKAEAEYTEAPASETITLVSFNSGCLSISSPASLSVSRDAVPLPIAIRSTACSFARCASFASAWSHLLAGTCGWITSVATTLPVASTTATFTPVRKPGSRPRVARVPAGAASSRSRRFEAKTRTASSSAAVRSRSRRSMPRCTWIRVRHAQRTVSASHLSPGRPRSPISKRRAIMFSYVEGPGLSAASGSSGSRTRSSTFSFSPRSIASTRCEGSAVNGSAKSK